MFIMILKSSNIQLMNQMLAHLLFRNHHPVKCVNASKSSNKAYTSKLVRSLLSDKRVSKKWMTARTATEVHYSLHHHLNHTHTVLVFFVVFFYIYAHTLTLDVCCTLPLCWNWSKVVCPLYGTLPATQRITSVRPLPTEKKEAFNLLACPTDAPSCILIPFWIWTAGFCLCGEWGKDWCSVSLKRNHSVSDFFFTLYASSSSFFFPTCGFLGAAVGFIPAVMLNQREHQSTGLTFNQKSVEKKRWTQMDMVWKHSSSSFHHFHSHIGNSYPKKHFHILSQPQTSKIVLV